MRRLSPRERFLIAIAGAALLVFVLVFGLILPMVGRGAQLARDESEYREIIAEAASMYEAVPATEADVAELRSEAARLMFP
ncbi:MAG: type II secretion system protein M, partial [Armatimonadetes bacterium]|nr:type II secretion system protein M [Armatimonadota bacterium]